MDILINFLVNPLSLNINTIFIISIITLSTVFVLCLTLSVFLREYGRAKRAWFLFVAGGISFFERAFTIGKDGGQALFCLTLAIGMIFSGIIFMVRVREKKASKEQKELLRLIDNHVKSTEIEREDNYRYNDVRVNAEPGQSGLMDSEHLNLSPVKDYGVDFEHVKRVIDKLQYYSLSQSDRKQVQDLTYALNDAERQGFSPLVKSKINEGLGALLKIMSKHGV